MRAWKVWMDETLKHMLCEAGWLWPHGRTRPGSLQGAVARVGQPQPEGKHEETRGVLQDIIH